MLVDLEIVVVVYFYAQLVVVCIWGNARKGVQLIVIIHMIQPVE
jgi:hypothetical protein